jgi:hypothetical protein
MTYHLCPYCNYRDDEMKVRDIMMLCTVVAVVVLAVAQMSFMWWSM